MGLFVRDECERLVKIQASKMNQCSSQLAREKLARRVTYENATCEAHDWKLKSHARLSSLRVIHEKGYLARYSRNSLFGKKIKCFTKFSTLTINTLITHNCKEYFLERKP